MRVHVTFSLPANLPMRHFAKQEREQKRCFDFFRLLTVELNSLPHQSQATEIRPVLFFQELQQFLEQK